MVNLRSIELNNFLSFEKARFNFNNGVYLVLGKNYDSEITDSNGAGKSSLFEAIVYAIYGKADRNYQRKGTNNTYVVLSFSYNNDDYKIIRYFNHYQRKNDIDIFKNDELISFHTKKEKQKFIETIFKLKYENFISSIVFKQGFDVKITDMTPSQRRDYFSNLIDIDFDLILKSIKKDLKALEYEKQEIEESIKNLQLEKARIEGKISVLSEQVDNTIRDKVRDIQKELTLLRVKQSDLESEYKKLKSEKEKAESLYIQKQSQLKFQLNQYRKLLSGVCPLCKSKVNVDDIYEKIKRIESELKEPFNYDDSALRELEGKLALVMDKIKELEVEYQLALRELRKQSQSEDINSLAKRLEEIEKELDKLNDNLFNVDVKIDKLNQLYKLFQPSGELRVVVLQSYIEVYNDLLNQFLKDIFPELKDVRLEISDDMKIEITGVDYKSLSGGEKRRLDFVFQLAYGEFISMLSDVDINIRVYDEVFDNLDEKAVVNILSYIQDLFFDKAVYFITHNENLKNLFENIILIEKRNGTSFIQNERV